MQVSTSANSSELVSIMEAAITYLVWSSISSCGATVQRSLESASAAKVVGISSLPKDAQLGALFFNALKIIDVYVLHYY